MRCKNCEYRLWGTTARSCPECGTHFLPSEFEFVPNSVRFGCPQCGQDYYGTTSQGHLSPYEFDCVRCGRRVSMDEMTLFPTGGLEEEQTQVEQMPWLVRGKIGFARAWLRTIYMGTVSPGRLIQLAPAGSSVASAWWFAALTAGLATLFGMLPFIIFPMIIMGAGGFGTIFGMVGTLGFLIWPSIIIAIWGGLAHGIVALTGKREYGPGRTFQAMCYSSAPNLLMAVPCMIMYMAPVAWIWWSINAILMLRHAQRIGTGRATIAVASLPLIMAAGLTALIIYVALPGFAKAQQFQAKFAKQTQLNALQIANQGLMASGLSNYVSIHDRLPGHASELIANNAVAASTFVHGEWSEVAPQIPVADADLLRFSELPSESQKELARAAAGSLPRNVIAHRLGDFVFTYHGIDLKNADPGLWTFVLAPEDPEFINDKSVHVGLADGTGSALPVAAFPRALRDQNSLRATSGLAPLSDPRNVTHTQPAAAR